MDEGTRLRIVQAAAELFLAKGYKSVTLAELAERLGMSKKTVYVYFSGKEQIAVAVIELIMAGIADKIGKAKEREGNPLHILRDTFSDIRREIVKLNPLFLADIQKYVPELWDKILAFRAAQLSFVEELLRKAQQSGFIRDVNPRLAAILITESIQTFIRPDFAAVHGVSIPELADTLFTLMLDGLRTQDDRETGTMTVD